MVSGTALFLALFSNLALLIVLVAAYGSCYNIIQKRSPFQRQVAVGLLFGCIVLICMHVKIPVYHGVRVDQRNAIVILCGLFGGPLAAVVSAFLGGVYRVLLGGDGICGGLVGLLLAAAVGSGLHMVRARIDSLWKIALASFCATVLVLPGFLPIGSLHEGWELLKSMALPYGTAIFLGIFFVWLLLEREEQRRRIERDLVDSEKRYRELFESLVDISYRIDRDGIVRIISPSCEKIMGFSPDEVIGKDLTDFYRNPQLRIYLVEQLMEQGRLDNFEVEIRKKDGSYGWLSSNARAILDAEGNYIGAEGVARDITQLRRTQDEKRLLAEHLRQSQKMESIGTLAGGIAHDFNNILAAIIGYAEMALQKIDSSHAASQDINGIMRAGLRAKELVRHILTFSRKSSYDTVPVEIHLALKEVLRLLRASTPSTIDIKESMHYRRGKVQADPTEIHQVIMNLCTNAVQAMEETGGVLSVSLEKAEIGEDEARPLSGLQPGAYVLIKVMDTGHGIPKENMDRLFDPFFTTKEIGKGTGMGLAVVHGIVARLNGTVAVESQPGAGAVFSVYLPECQDSQPDSVQKPSITPKGNERILLVDDEPIVVEVTRRRLELLGYRVTSFLQSDEALESFRSDPEAFDCVITDQTMPKLTGEQLARAVLDMRPGIPVILCTGYSAVINEEKARKIGIRAFLMKPFNHQDLAESVRHALDYSETVTIDT